MNKIKFFKSTPLYDIYLDFFYKSHTYLINASYSEQYKTIMADCFSWADFWKKNLEKTGNYIAEEVIINCEYLQKKWAQEHNVTYSNENWILDILEKQIKEFCPDVWFAHDFSYINPEFRNKILKKNKNIKLVIAWDGIGLKNHDVFKGCDVILSCLENVADYYSRFKDMKGCFFPFGYETTIGERLHTFDKKYPVSFVGSIFLSEGQHQERCRLISQLISKTPIYLWISSYRDKRILHFLKEQMIRLKKKKFQEFFEIIKINLNNIGAAFGIDMYNILANSQITLNSHINAAGTKGGNSRLVEATGVGACLVTDWKENIHEYFEIDKEVIVYKSNAECIEKINYLINHDSVRKAIAEAGQKKTINNYSFYKRIHDFSKFLEKNI